VGTVDEIEKEEDQKFFQKVEELCRDSVMREYGFGEVIPIKRILIVNTYLWRPTLRLIEEKLIDGFLVGTDRGFDNVSWWDSERKCEVRCWHDNPVRDRLTWWENYYHIERCGLREEMKWPEKNNTKT